VPPAICHVTELPGVIATFAGEKLVPTVVTTLFCEDGEPGVDGEEGVDGFWPAGSGSTAAPPPPHASDTTLITITARFISSLSLLDCEKKGWSNFSGCADPTQPPYGGMPSKSGQLILSYGEHVTQAWAHNMN
jgi:hypothetical protein